MAGRRKESVAGFKDTVGGVKRDDRYQSYKTVFEPISIDAENALTVILLLASPEDNVILRAVASLERFGRKARENLQLLTSLGIYDYIICLVRHDDHLIRRFAQKLVAFLCSLEEFRKLIFAEEATVNIFVTILDEEDDVVMHEFSSLALAELSSECYAAGRILQINGCVDVIYSRLPSTDPDVQKNCLDIIRNLLREVDGVKYFVSSPSFSMKPFLDLTSSNYPIIQVGALEVIDTFLTWSMNNKVIYALRDDKGIEIIIGIVENAVWTDLHMLALNIVLKVTENPAISEYLQYSGCIQQLASLLNNTDDKNYIEKLLGALARISRGEAGRKVLHGYTIGQVFGEYLKSDWVEVQEEACLGIANMAKYPPAISDIMSTEPTLRLLDILTNSENEWRLREMASYALNILSHEDYRVAEALLESEFDRFLPIFKDKEHVPVEIIQNILQIFMGISKNDKFRLMIINESLIQAIMSLIQDIDEQHLKPASMQVAALECLSSLMIEEEARCWFHSLGGVHKIISCLKNRYASIRQWAALLTTQLSQNIDFVKAFIHFDGLKWLIDAREMRFSAPSWESAIEAVFRAYLPAKFAYTGRLELHDLTEDEFYIFRHPRKIFFVIDDLLEIRASPAYPLYMVSFGSCPFDKSRCSDELRSWESDKLAQSQDLTKDTIQEKNSQMNQQQTEHSSNDTSCTDDYSDSYRAGMLSDPDLDRFACLPRDPYLQQYIESLKNKLAKGSESNGISDPHWLAMHPKLIRQRAQILARFVADEMAGVDPNPVCKNHCLDMHLNDIRYELETNIIPLGFIRIGSYLERALLFKVLADKIGLPCALVRGMYGRAWVEIAIPVINIEETTETKETQTSLAETPPSMLSVISGDITPKQESKRMIRNICELPCYKSTGGPEKFTFPSLRVTSSQAFPTRLLKTNAIVDLVQEPGRIINIESYEADEYRGSFLRSNRKKNCA